MTRFKKFTLWGLSSIASYVLGGLSNNLAFILNKDKMPVAYDGHMWPEVVVTNARHATMAASTHVKVLCDYIPIGDYIYSPGDIMLYSGQYSMIVFIAALSFIGYLSLTKK